MYTGHGFADWGMGDVDVIVRSSVAGASAYSVRPRDNDSRWRRRSIIRDVMTTSKVPNLLELKGRYYLIGSIREDIKVHYWQSDEPEGPYGNFFDNVLLPQGNYAARVCRAGERFLLWNFYFKSVNTKSTGNMLPPPKELVVTGNGQLKLKSFAGFDGMVNGQHTCDELTPLRIFGRHPSAKQTAGDSRAWFGCESAFEIFLLRGRYSNFRMRCTVEMVGTGKWGFVIHLSENTDGYFVSLDLIKGLVQLRAWGERPDGGIEGAFRYKPLRPISSEAKEPRLMTWS
jgi:beta-fructofuranosidase